MKINFNVKTAKNNLKYIFIHYFFQNVLSLSDSKLINIYVRLKNIICCEKQKSFAL